MFARNSRLLALAPPLALLTATAASLTIVEYQIPREKAFPHDPAVDAAGIVWYTDQQNSYIGRLDPETSKITDYATPTPSSGPHGIVIAPDGQVWYTGNRVGKIGRLDPKTGHITEYALPSGVRDPHTPLFHNGIVWFTAQQSNMYGRLDPKTGEAKVWTVPTPRALPYGMVAAPDGSIWMALFGTNKLGHIDPQSGELQEITLAALAARPRRLVVDEVGVIWYTDYARGKLGSLDPKTGVAKEWDSPSGEKAAPYGIAMAPDGRIFYDESGTGQVIAFDRKTRQMTVVKIPTPGAIVRNISVDSARKRIWLALSGTGRLGKIDLQ